MSHSKWILLTSLAFALVLGQGCITKPVTLEIFHVNDLHSNFDFGRTPDKGGYAALKFALDGARAGATARGSQSLVLNGGDNFEGHPYYFVGNGAESMRLLAAMNFDASVVGNHDFLMGAAGFDALVGQAPPGLVLLGGNIDFDRSKYPNLGRGLTRFAQFNKGGLRIAVIGLTTNSPMYRWAAGDVVIGNPIVHAVPLIAQLRAQNDIVIVLSHLGTADDINLVQHTAGIDLVVGAHDHVALAKPLLKKDLSGRTVPILQSEPFGEGIGHLTITVNRDRTSSINGYEIIPVTGNVSGKKDATIDALVKSAAAKLVAQFGDAYLNEQLAVSQSALENDENQPTEMGQLTADALKEAAGAELAIDASDFHGMTQPAGTITRLTLMKMYPRMFAFTPSGWNVYTMQLPAALLQKTLELVEGSSFRISVSGATFDSARDASGNVTLSDLRVNGAAVDPARVYTVAVPEGVARALLEIPKLYEGLAAPVLGDISSDLSTFVLGFITGELSLIDGTIKNTNTPVWTALETKVRALKALP